jgi:hypothetical protein
MWRNNAVMFAFVFEGGGGSSYFMAMSRYRKYRHHDSTCDANAALRYLKPLVWQPVIATFAGERYKTLGSALPEWWSKGLLLFPAASPKCSKLEPFIRFKVYKQILQRVAAAAAAAWRSLCAAGVYSSNCSVLEQRAD